MSFGSICNIYTLVFLLGQLCNPESSALPTSQCCIKCSDAAQYRCIECGPVAYFCHFCHVCFGEAHSFTNVFHAAEIWEVNNKSGTVIGLQIYY